ncbi:hypothetical protein C2869_18420 [Saccharobesus litoralis]|uniref:Lipoprotein n=1 Tax=Saccharobesus litoralis TaxID=2172099 RepID=A0A2S0VVM1_9ALTE|nr:hypothetical protein [Saccharobesus litoralis]AWB68266.1 hypothetical protein C2869_18420 [Saccharobesus litoralis]
MNILLARKYTLLLIVSAVLLAGCASKPAYRAASHGGYGYQESVISEDRYRVSFKTRGDKKMMAMDFATLRAAELTQQQGYDWFIIVSRDSMVNKTTNNQAKTSFGTSREYTTTRSCGLLGCKTTTHPTTRTELGMSFGDEHSEVQSIIEIKMGKGVRPENVDSYNAQEVKRNVYQQYAIQSEGIAGEPQ